MAFSFNPAQTGGGSGLALSALASAANPTTTTATGFSFGTATNPVTTAGGAAKQPAFAGFNFSTTTSTATSTSAPTLGLGTAATTKPLTGFPAATTKPLTGFPAATTKPLTGFPATTSTTTAAGLKLGTATTSGTAGLTLTGLTTTSSSAPGGFTFGGLGTTTTSAGLLAAKPATTTAAATTSSGGLTLGGLGGTSSTPATSSSVVKGLGGVDPATSTQNANKASGSSGDGKRVKEEAMPVELVETVTKFKQYVKEQKEVGAKISVVSNQQMTKVKEQTGSLKHLLSTVAVGLHRNVVALDKLKKQTSQELHNVEMAHRTKETPAGLQYENNAPNQYFYELLESFDSRMTLYKKLIEDTEGYLVSAQQGTSITPKDLFVCLKRLHETFIALAAQIQGIHEQIKKQKEHYLAYRKVFHNDETDVFAKRKKSVTKRDKLARTSQPLGPTPFTGLSNYAAMMMSTAMNQQASQPVVGAFGQPATSTATQPPTGGLFGNTTTGFGGFGAATTQGSSLFGGAAASKPTFGFGTTTTSAPSAFGFPSANTTAAKPTGFGFGASTTTTAPAFGFGSTTTTSAPTAFGFGSAAASKPTGFGFGSTPASTGTSLFGSQTTAAVKPLGLALPATNQSTGSSFTLQPAPSKRPGTTFDTPK